MRTSQLALCIALVATAFVPTASACCVHTTRAIAWAEYASTGDAVACAVASAPAPVQEEGCLLAVDGVGFRLAVVDASAAAVSFTWDACGATGDALGSGFVDVPEGCSTVHVALGPEATVGVLRQLLH